jgi:hypothetical protein
MFAPSGTSRDMRMILLATLMLCACGKEQPAAPTPEQSGQLNDAENMLNGMAQNEEGPEQRPGPSNHSD